MFDLNAVQAAIREEGLDGWLLFDFRGSNILARRIVEFAPDAHATRRWMYFVPASGTPKKLCHRIEPGMLDHLPGERTIYLRWQEFEAGVASLLQGRQRVAMEYSPRNGNPYVSRVDAGTVELVKSNGVDIVSSGDLVQRFEAVWTPHQWELHLQAGEVTNSAFRRAWEFIASEIRSCGETTESAVAQLIETHFRDHDMVTDSTPIVAVNAHSGDPHYSTGDAPIREGDFVLIDQWAKSNCDEGVYSDLTRTGFVGDTVPTKYREVFDIVANARDTAIAAVKEAFAANQPLRGCDVDDVCRGVIEAAGYGDAFVHRTGHSIGRETHGNGANIDNLETHDSRRIMPGTCFSIEPGIYLPEFGIRSEVNVFVDFDRTVHVTAGEIQREIIPILGKIPE